MSRKARGLPFPASDAPSVSPASLAERWRALFGSEPPRAAGLVEQAVAWREQVLAGGDVAPAIARDLAIAARQVSEARGHSAGVAARVAPLIDGAAAAVVEAPCTSSPAAEDLPAAAPAQAPSAPAPARPAAPRTRARAAPTPLPPASSQLLPGTRLVKAHGGRNHVVEVTGSGFLYEGAAFTSLSAVARHITGTHWNGLLFFGLRRRKTYPRAVRHG